jgi:YHS domain-containing protein
MNEDTGRGLAGFHQLDDDHVGSGDLPEASVMGEDVATAGLLPVEASASGTSANRGRQLGQEDRFPKVALGTQTQYLQGGNTMAMVTDPVCGMRIDSDDAVATAEHEGKTYYFCSRACHDAFVADPASYAA